MLRRFLPLVLFGALLVSACDDPSNVGLGLVGGEGGAPEIFRTPATPFVLDEDQHDIGGGTALVLAGQVSDPLLGEMQADAYLDFGDPSAVGSGNLSRFRGATVRQAYLQMPRRYLYGDTLSTVAFTLHDLADEFDQIGLPTDADPDTAFSIGSLVTTFSYALPDSLVKVPLPASWVTANDTTLRSSIFPASFNGFRMQASGGNAVIGFTPGTVRLFAVTDEDTVAYVANKSATLTRRVTEPTLPDGYVLIQDGFSNTYSFPLDSPPLDQVKGNDLSRVALEIQTDPTLLAQTPPNFVRPTLSTLELLGADSTGTILFRSATANTLCERAVVCAKASPTAEGRAVFFSAPLTSVGRLLLLDEPSPINRAFLRPPTESGTLSATVLRAPGTDEAPTLVFTVIPIE